MKIEIDKNKFNQNFTNIQLNDMFTTGINEFEEVNEKTNSFIDETLIKNKKTTVQYIIAILLESKLVAKRDKARQD